jgi:hypothetical protein
LRPARRQPLHAGDRCSVGAVPTERSRLPVADQAEQPTARCTVPGPRRVI